MNDEDRYELGLGISISKSGFKVSGRDGHLTYLLDVGLVAGRFVCTRLEISPDPDHEHDGVTAEAIRELPIARLVSDGAREKCVQEEERLRGTAAKMIEQAGGRPDDLVLEAVAAAYRYGYAVSDSPTREVMRLLDLPRSKANRWIAEAREEGFLGHTEQRRPGGVEEADAETALRRAEEDVAHAEQLVHVFKDELRQVNTSVWWPDIAREKLKEKERIEKQLNEAYERLAATRAKRERVAAAMDAQDV